MKYADSVSASLKFLLYKMSLEQSVITTGPLLPRSLSVTEERYCRGRAHHSRPSHPFLPPSTSLSDSVYICLSV